MNNQRFILLILCILVMGCGMELCLQAASDELMNSEGELQLDNSFHAEGIYPLNDKADDILGEKESTDKKNFIIWNLDAASANIESQIIQVNNFILNLQDKKTTDSLNIISPYCIINQKEGEISSNSSVIISGNGLKISGIGYNIFCRDNDVIIVIRHAVTLFVNRQKIATFKDIKNKNKNNK